MGDSKSGLDSQVDWQLRLVLRFASYVLPCLSLIVALLLGWRQHFVWQSIPGVVGEIGGSIYIAIFLHRRSRGQSARIFNAATGPSEDQSSQDQTDIGVLWGGAIYIGMLIYVLIQFW
jgi:hypothetical protein